MKIVLLTEESDQLAQYFRTLECESKDQRLSLTRKEKRFTVMTDNRVCASAFIRNAD